MTKSSTIAPKRISPEYALDLLRRNDLADLGKRAHESRLRIADPDTATYLVDRNINYSNVCVSQCDFCAFYREPAHPEAYVISDGELIRKVQELVDVGGTTVLLQGGVHPSLPFSFYTRMLASIKDRFEIHLHAFSPPEIIGLSRLTNRPVREILVDLKDAGLDSLPGGGAEILSDRVRRRISPRKCTADEWIMVMHEAHRIGLPTTATMMFGHVESYEDRIEHLSRLRDLQDCTGGFTAFICWTFQPKNTRLVELITAGGHEYLKTLAVSRLFLDNFPHVQASLVTQGEEVGQLALFFGADDIGGTTIEENVVRLAGASHCASEHRLRELIEDAGFRPQKRNTKYEWIS